MFVVEFSRSVLRQYLCIRDLDRKSIHFTFESLEGPKAHDSGLGGKGLIESAQPDVLEFEGLSRSCLSTYGARTVT